MKRHGRLTSLYSMIEELRIAEAQVARSRLHDLQATMNARKSQAFTVTSANHFPGSVNSAVQTISAAYASFLLVGLQQEVISRTKELRSAEAALQDARLQAKQVVILGARKSETENKFKMREEQNNTDNRFVGDLYRKRRFMNRS